jgi:hypothetical protein
MTKMNPKKRSASTSECPAIVGFKNENKTAAGLRRALCQPGVAHGKSLGIVAKKTAPAV